MSKTTKLQIIEIAKRLFAKNGYEGFSMRILAKECGVGVSSIYHFFLDKDELLEEIFNKTNKSLGVARLELPIRNTPEDLMMDRIKFQFSHIEDVVFVLKYYLHFRPKYLKMDSGYLPTKAYLHIEEVLSIGVQEGIFKIKQSDVDKEAKVIAHAINGFLLEYYPETPEGDELVEVTNSIHRFLIRSLTNKEVA